MTQHENVAAWLGVTSEELTVLLEPFDAYPVVYVSRVLDRLYIGSEPPTGSRENPGVVPEYKEMRLR